MINICNICNICNNSCNNSCNNEIDINYILYRKIFSNIYLRQLIIQFIKELNINEIYKFINKYNRYLIEKNDSQRIQDILNNSIYGYNKIPISVIFQKELVEIFKDNLKSNSKALVDQYSVKGFHHRFIRFVFNCKIGFEDFKRFYFLNKQLLLRNEEDPSVSSRRVDLFECLVQRKEFKLLEFVYQDQKEEIQTEKDYYYKLKKLRQNDIDGKNGGQLERNGYNLSILPMNYKEFTDKVKSPFSIYFNNHIICVAFQESTLEICKFLIETLELDFECYHKDLLYWALSSKSYRIQLVHYLLNELNYQFPKYYCGSYDHYFQYLLLLDYKTFKRVLTCGSPTFYNHSSDLLISKLFALSSKSFYNSSILSATSSTLSQTSSSTSISTSLLDFILIIIHIVSIEKDKSIHFIIILKIIKQLIKYNNDNRNNNKITNKSIQKLVNNLIKKHQSQKDKSLLNNIISLFSPKSNNNKEIINYYINRYIDNSNEDCNNNDSERNELKSSSSLDLGNSSSSKNDNGIINFIGFERYFRIDYNNFNLEKEVYKIYIFEFLPRLKLEKHDLVAAVGLYCSKFNQYELLIH